MSETSGEVILYRSGDGDAVLQLRAVGGTVWLSQGQLAELYGTSVPNIVQIVRRVLADGEVDAATTNSELRVQQEGARRVRREVKIYNLGSISASEAGLVVAGRFADFDQRRRSAEAVAAADLELDELGALADVERMRKGELLE